MRYLIVTFLVVLLMMPVFGQSSTMSLISVEDAVNMALENNPAVTGLALQLEQSDLMKSAAWDFKPMEFTYRSGQLYPSEYGRYLEINQDFGSLLEHINKTHLADKNRQLNETAYSIAEKELTVKVKSAYYFWVYSYNRLVLLEEKDEVFSDLERIAELKYLNGEIDLMKKSELCTKAAAISMERYQLQDQLEMARNTLKQLIVTENEILPVITELTPYLINKSADTAMYDNHVLADYYNNLQEFDALAAKSKSALFFPEVSLGFVNQHIPSYPDLWAWQLKLSVPLLFFDRKAELQQAKLKALLSSNQYDYQQFAINKTIDNLILDLNRTFKKLVYFDQYALSHAYQIRQTATLRFEKEEIEYPEYTSRVAESIALQMEYLETLNQYNQTAIQLEFYAN